jgi:glucosamine 6-phosphate synthetase-like amidotransferase/phosphosugar isomerase protein
MCGVFGFTTHGKHGPNLKILKLIAQVTERRGPHAFGFAWIDSKGRLKCFKQQGKITDHLGLLSLARDARMLIGHCRFATQGNPCFNINNHPHPCDGGWIVHNGQIRNYLSLLNRFQLHPVSHCDSEVLGLLVEQEKGTYLDRCLEAVRSVNSQPLVMLGLWARPERLIAIRDGNPLHVGEDSNGIYLASLDEGLPGEVKRFPDLKGYEWTVEQGVTETARV